MDIATCNFIKLRSSQQSRWSELVDDINIQEPVTILLPDDGSQPGGSVSPLDREGIVLARSRKDFIEWVCTHYHSEVARHLYVMRDTVDIIKLYILTSAAIKQ